MPRYIDADEVKKAIEESWDGCLGSYDSHEITMNDLWVIDRVQTADVVERKRGKWINCVNSEHWKCSQCGCRAGFWFNEENSSEWEKDMSEWLSDFCPNCGAEMEEMDD